MLKILFFSSLFFGSVYVLLGTHFWRKLEYRFFLRKKRKTLELRGIELPKGPNFYTRVLKVLLPKKLDI